jgi:hypothetical protein
VIVAPEPTLPHANEPFDAETLSPPKEVGACPPAKLLPEAKIFEDPTVILPLNVLVAVVDVAVNEPARALFPRSEDPFTESARHGVVVPTPIFPAKYAFPVVVAPPLIVSPVACPPAPIVVEAYEVRPPLNERRVDVAFDGKR